MRRKRKLKLLGAVLCSSLFFSVSAQDDLLKMLEDEEAPKTDYTIATFKGTRVVNLHSPEQPGKGVLQYMFNHRFGAFNNDYFYNFLGMVNAEVRLQLDYGITDWLNAGLGHGTASPRTYDAFVKYRLLRQSKGEKSFPFTIVGYSALYYNYMRFGDDLPHYDSERLSFVNELIIARKFSQNFSLEVVPTHVHFNLVNLENEPNDIFSLGFAGRYKITPALALTAEYIYQLNPLETNLESVFPFEDNNHLQDNQNVLSLGLDIETGGHVFQLFLTNSMGVSDPYTIAQTTGQWSEGDIHFGFNISRVFTIVRPKEFEEGE